MAASPARSPDGITSTMNVGRSRPAWRRARGHNPSPMKMNNRTARSPCRFRWSFRAPRPRRREQTPGLSAGPRQRLHGGRLPEHPAHSLLVGRTPCTRRRWHLPVIRRAPTRAPTSSLLARGDMPPLAEMYTPSAPLGPDPCLHGRRVGNHRQHAREGSDTVLRRRWNYRPISARRIGSLTFVRNHRTGVAITCRANRRGAMPNRRSSRRRLNTPLLAGEARVLDHYPAADTLAPEEGESAVSRSRNAMKVIGLVSVATTETRMPP